MTSPSSQRRQMTFWGVGVIIIGLFIGYVWATRDLRGPSPPCVPQSPLFGSVFSCLTTAIGILVIIYAMRKKDSATTRGGTPS